jgi:hypothetical protein
MSLNVLILPEDATYDKDVLKPIVGALLGHLGRPQAKVRVHSGFGGLGDALKWECVSKVLDQYRGMVDLFVLVVDRDGDAHRAQALARLEARATVGEGAHPPFLTAQTGFFAENAWQEVEVWVLAGCDDLPTEWSWQDIRAERDSKERYYNAYAARHDPAWDARPTDGLRQLAAEAARRYDRIRRLCFEDVGRLEQRIGDWLAARA